jgi:hypothetical protein
LRSRRASRKHYHATTLDQARKWTSWLGCLFYYQ